MCFCNQQSTSFQLQGYSFSYFPSGGAFTFAFFSHFGCCVEEFYESLWTLLRLITKAEFSSGGCSCCGTPTAGGQPKSLPSKKLLLNNVKGSSYSMSQY